LGKTRNEVDPVERDFSDEILSPVDRRFRRFVIFTNHGEKIGTTAMAARAVGQRWEGHE
jgi:hypothetical protein